MSRPTIEESFPKPPLSRFPGVLWHCINKAPRPRYIVTILTFCVLLVSYVQVVTHYFPEVSYTAIRGTAILGSAVYDDVSSSDIAVIEINDEYLKFVGESWPLSYAAYAAMLDDVALYQPASVFMDVAFIHTRPDKSLPQLIDSICRLHARKIRVYLAGLENESGQLRLRPELETPEVRPCYTIVGIRYDPAPNTKLALTYPLLGNGVHHSNQNDPTLQAERHKIPSAAYAIARDHDRDQQLSARLAAVDNPSMALTWSLKSHPDMQWKLWEGCSIDPLWTWEILPQPVQKLLLDWIPKQFPKRQMQAPCPSQRHVPLNLLTDPQTTEARDWLRRNLQYKHVMIGSAVAGVNDIVQSPIHGDVPGIYLHAMALDNLLHDGAGYKLPGSLYERSPSVFWLLALLLALVNYRIYAGLHRWLKKDTKMPCQQPKLERFNASPQQMVCNLARESKQLVLWLFIKGFEILFSIVLALAVFYVMQRTTTYAIQDLAQLVGVVLALQWTGVTATVVNAVIRAVCVPTPSTSSGDTP